MQNPPPGKIQWTRSLGVADVGRRTSQSEDAGRHTDIHHHFYLPVEHSPLTRNKHRMLMPLLPWQVV
jgi:hypothetical protein